MGTGANQRFFDIRRMIKEDLASDTLVSLYISHLSYISKDRFVKLADILDMTNFHFLEGKNSTAIVIETEDTVFVSFKGMNYKDPFHIKKVLEYVGTPFNYVLAHSGFVELVKEHIDAIKAILLRHNKRLVFCGHSLGGAQCELLATAIKPDVIITFGCPRVFLRDQTFENFTGIKHLKFASDKDFVCHLPFALVKFKHSKKPIKLADQLNMNFIKNHLLDNYVKLIMSDDGKYSL